jgi:DNA processing protein
LSIFIERKTSTLNPNPLNLMLFSAPPSDAKLDLAREKNLEFLRHPPVSVDELIRQCHLSTSVILTVLLELELTGRLERQAGQRVVLIG